MEEIVKLFIGIIFLALGFPIGDYLREKTKDEQKQGRIWFRILTTIGLLGGLLGLIFQNDWMLFTFFFIAIVTSRNLIKEKKLKKKRRLSSRK
jgi:hypothetical protein